MKGDSATRSGPAGEEHRGEEHGGEGHRSDRVLRATLPAPGGRTSLEVEELVLASKVRRPLLPRDLVSRPRLFSQLEPGDETPLTVVVAPAGYGKTTLVSHWLESTRRPSAWVSLADGDDDLEAFVLHVVAAMRRMSPSVMTRTTRFIREGSLPSPGALALALLNDLSDVDHAFVLVLDGTEVIRDRRTLQILSSLLKHPPAHMHLVLAGRWDPFLATASIKVAPSVAEIRAGDLRFTPHETLTLLEHSRVAREATPSAAEAWTAATEGWITGLKLAISEISPTTAGSDAVHALTRRVRAYLLSEVMAHQPSSVRRFLLDASILDRLCEPLCRALCGEADRGALDDVADRGLQILRDQGLFLVPLDASGEWFRFHGLLRDLLTGLREREGDSERDAALRRRAAAWFASNGHLEEAVWHALSAGDSVLAGALVETQADRTMDAGAWGVIARAVQRLPSDLIEASPRLLVVSAWVSLHLGRLTEAEGAADRAALLSPENDASLSAFRSALTRARGDFAATVDWAQSALAGEARLAAFDRSVALTNLYAAYYLTGDGQIADSLAETVLADTRPESSRTRERLLALMCAMRWRDGDLTGLDDASARSEQLARAEALPRAMAVAELYRGLVSYERNDLPRAREHLATAMGARGALTDEEQLQARYGLARVHRAQGCHSAALEVSGLRLDGTDARSADATPGPTWTHRSLRADLAIAYGKAQVALGVVEPSVAAPADRATSWLDPSLTLARALLLQGERASTQRARDVLATVDEGDAAMRGCRFRLERHCLGALLAAQEEDDEMVAEEMHEALTLAERAGFLRYLVDFGAPLAELLKPFARHATLGPHARRVLAAYYEDTLASGTLETGMEALATETPHELLTPRESETLRLLSRGLANNEIAEQSFVSVDTVKTHLKNIYRKLNVRSRRQAVSRARAIGLLAEA